MTKLYQSKAFHTHLRHTAFAPLHLSLDSNSTQLTFPTNAASHELPAPNNAMDPDASPGIVDAATSNSQARFRDWLSPETSKVSSFQLGFIFRSLLLQVVQNDSLPNSQPQIAEFWISLISESIKPTPSIPVLRA
jgi:hypothetical protein